MFRLKSIILFSIFHKLISTNTFSRWTGSLAGSRGIPKWLLAKVIRNYIRFYRIDMTDFEIDLTTINTFNEFFTRPLKKGARVWGQGVCSPVDGRLLCFGAVEEGKMYQIKGISYAQDVLLGQPGLTNGSYATIYLAPGDYHRVHAPFDMRIEEITHIPGELLSVSLMNVRHIPALYNKLERVVLSGKNEFGKFHFVFVGAFNVGSIRLSFMEDFTSNRKNIREIRKIRTSVEISKGEELGWFELGSTVVMMTESKLFESGLEHLLFQKISLGQTLAQQ